MNKKLNKKGFTLIEVVLVLAIGGLIFLLAFLAFGQASKNRRDTQRRADASRIIAELQNYYGDNKQTYPVYYGGTSGDICTVTPSGADFAKFAQSYLCTNGKFVSPSGANYITNNAISLLNIAGGINSQPTDTVLYANDFKCDPNNNNNVTDVNAQGIQVVAIKLEKGFICRDTSK